MRKAKFVKQKKKLFKNTTENNFDMIHSLLEILKLKLIIKILELLDK